MHYFIIYKQIFELLFCTLFSHLLTYSSHFVSHVQRNVRVTDVMDLAREPNHLRVLTKQANDCWRACFATRIPPRSTGIKGECVQTHISFSLRSRAF